MVPPQPVRWGITTQYQRVLSHLAASWKIPLELSHSHLIVNIDYFMGPKISVIIPNYNNAAYLRDCLTSVQAQTLRDFECLVIDDGSTDGSVDVITEFVARDERFMLFATENRGVSAARNVGLEHAQGEYVAFLDSDDAFTNIALESMYCAANRHDADLVGGAAIIVPENFRYMPSSARFDFQATAPLAVFRGSEDVLISFSKTYDMFGEEYKTIWIWRQLFRRALIADHSFVNGLCPGDDICFMLDIYNYARCVVVTRFPTTYHRLSATSLMNNGLNRSQISFFVPALRYIRDNVRDRYPDWFMNNFYNSFARYLFTFSLMMPVKEKSFRDAAAVAMNDIMKEGLVRRDFFTWFQRLLIKILIFAYLPKERNK